MPGAVPAVFAAAEAAAAALQLNLDSEKDARFIEQNAWRTEVQQMSTEQAILQNELRSAFAHP